jgi:hypothetical protein
MKQKVSVYYIAVVIAVIVFTVAIGSFLVGRYSQGAGVLSDSDRDLLMRAVDVMEKARHELIPLGWSHWAQHADINLNAPDWPLTYPVVEHCRREAERLVSEIRMLRQEADYRSRVGEMLLAAERAAAVYEADLMWLLPASPDAANYGDWSTWAPLTEIEFQAARCRRELGLPLDESWVDALDRVLEPPYEYPDLFSALHEGRPQDVKAFLKDGRSVDERIGAGESAPALWFAADAGNAEVVAFLLAEGADPDAYHKGFEISALRMAARKGYARVVQALVVAGASLSRNEGPRRMTPLMHAAENGRWLACWILVENGASRAPKDSEGRTALDIARTHGHNEIVRLLETRQTDAIDLAPDLPVQDNRDTHNAATE